MCIAHLMDEGIDLGKVSVTQLVRGRAGIGAQVCAPNQWATLPLSKTFVSQIVLPLTIDHVMNSFV